MSPMSGTRLTSRLLTELPPEPPSAWSSVFCSTATSASKIFSTGISSFTTLVDSTSPSRSLFLWRSSWTAAGRGGGEEHRRKTMKDRKRGGREKEEEQQKRRKWVWEGCEKEGQTQWRSREGARADKRTIYRSKGLGRATHGSDHRTSLRTRNTRQKKGRRERRGATQQIKWDSCR